MLQKAFKLFFITSFSIVFSAFPLNTEVLKAIQNCTLSIVSSAENTIEESHFFLKNQDSKSKNLNYGTGFIFSENAKFEKYIITNFHVIEPALKNKNNIFGCNLNGCFKITALAIDKENDLAILSNKPDFLCNSDFTLEDNPQEVSKILILGNKLGLNLSFNEGILAAKSRKLTENKEFHLLDVSAGHGNSGGPIFLRNTTKIIGVLTTIYSGNTSVNIPLAIPANVVKNSITKMKSIMQLENLLEFEIIENNDELFFIQNNTLVFFKQFSISKDDKIQAINGKSVNNKVEAIYLIYEFLESEERILRVTYFSKDKKLKSLRLEKN